MAEVDHDETHGLGYEHVDDDPNVSVLLAAMDDTARWEATIELRAWERAHLGPSPGDRILDVGCGRGDAVLSLAADLGPSGTVVGIDSSSAMITAAKMRAGAVRCNTRFTVGDALDLGESDASFDMVRSERTLQWVADPQQAVNEMARVVTHGGMVSLIDTDWSTFQIDVEDEDIARRVRTTMATERRRPSKVGGRLASLAEQAGLHVVSRSTATQRWSSWDPDQSPAPPGCFSMTSLADDLIAAGQLEAAARDEFIATIHDAARSGKFRMFLSMYGVVAQRSRQGIDDPGVIFADGRRTRTGHPGLHRASWLQSAPPFGMLAQGSAVALFSMEA